MFRYANPDADPHAAYDTFSADHLVVVEQRARQRQLRQFSKHSLGSRRPRVSGSCEMLVEADAEQAEWDTGHIRRREELVKSFMIAWDNGNAEWLRYPDRSKQ